MDVYEWIKQHVTYRLEKNNEWLCELIGGEVGDCDRRERLAMEKYVAEHLDRLGMLIAQDHKQLKALVEAQAKTIETLSRKVSTLETKAATRKKTESVEQYIPSMRGTSLPRRLS